MSGSEEVVLSAGGDGTVLCTGEGSGNGVGVEYGVGVELELS